MKKNIFVVDDEYEIVELLKAVLEAENFNVITANNGAEALEKLKKTKPDLILLDMMMPGLTGRQVRDRIRKNPKTKNIKIIFVTVIKMADLGKEILEDVNVSDYITKPFDIKDLVRRVKIALDLMKE
ncbi:MAG: response regulator [Nanoarchaeota archaeon]|nr:response regulator [Nanoarchaeota archaeon]